MIRFRERARFDAEAVLLFITEEQWGGKAFPAGCPDSLRESLRSVSSSGFFRAVAREVFVMPWEGRLVLLAGLGKKEACGPTEQRIAVRTALRDPSLRRVKTIEIIPFSMKDEAVVAVIEGILIGTYAWTKYVTPSREDPPVRDKDHILAVAEKAAYRRAIAVCEGVTLTRDLVNENAEIVTSLYMEKTVRDLVSGCSAASLEVLGRKEMEKVGLRLHLAVNRGSRNEPKLIVVRYAGGRKKDPWTALIGKGLTFDSGGINLKPSGHIETMRCDMAGSAAVAGVLKNTLALKLKVNALFVMAMAENAIDAGSFKPGDVLRAYDGTTVEIGNTDAEGRLVLADAIGYVRDRHRPDRIIDLATLTGACIVALGHDFTGLTANDDRLAEAIRRSARATDDWVWRLPLYPELKDHIKSKVADVKNISNYRGVAGTLTAAEFLRRFVGDCPWAHLDIAGTAFNDHERLYFTTGATGSGVRLLTHFLDQE